MMLKNKQLLRHTLLLLLVGGCGTGAVFLISRPASLICLCMAVIMAGAELFFTCLRYREIGKLSDYLRRIAGGDNTLELPDYEEGELSVLKTGIYKTAATLRFQAEEMQKDKLYLAEALTDISHQLKTPVTSMIVMSDLLQNEELEQSQRREFLDNLDRQLEKTQWIITNLLKLSKIDAGQTPFHTKPFSLCQMVEDATAPLQILMELKKQTLTVEGDPEVLVTGDSGWTTEAVSNIIKNCAEHTPAGGGVWVEYRSNTLYTWLRIWDNGPGIDKEDVPHIFERFYKGKNSGADSVGIGLALAKTILNQENAKIEVQSVPGEGTSFEIRFYDRTV